MKKLLTFIFVLCAASAAAQRIDFSFSNAQEAQTHEPDYIEWKIPHAESATMVLDNGMELSIAATGNANVLRDQWNKNTCNAGRDGATGLRLLGDGVVAFIDDNGNTPTLTDTPTSIEIKVKGLTAGSHTAMAYHVWKDVKSGEMPKIKVELKINKGAYTVKQTDVDFVNVKNPVTDLKMADATYSYVGFDIEEGDSVYLRYTTVVEAGKTYQTTNVMLNALLLDTSPFVAQDPIPNSRDYHYDCDDGSCELQWTAGPTAAKHRLYFGTDADEVERATAWQYEGTATSYTATGLTTHNIYYWRVDEVEADGTVHKGLVWSFRPRHLAFPDAEGYGRYAIGGRGGVVYHVISLSGGSEPGTLLYGLTEMTGPRYIVFDVSGIIELDFSSSFTKPYAYIAGQTAPGKGICIKASNINIGSDVICRHIRFKRGLGVYGENTGNAMGMSGADHAIVDHCTAAWGTDETVSGRGAKNISFQYSVISEALGIAGHKNYADGTNHGYAATIDGQRGSWHHNLLVNCSGRNWSMGGGMDANNIPIGGLDLFNNVVYNWNGRTTDGNCHEVNFVGNYYKMGPDTRRTTLFTQDFEPAINPEGTDIAYVSGNIRENKDHSLTTDAKNNTYNATGNIPTTYEYLVNEPLFPSFATIHTAKDAMKIVTSYSGATMPMADEHHRRNVRETIDGTWTYKGSKSGIRGEIDTEEDITEHAAGKGWEVYPEVQREADYDTDGDGIPNWYERLIGSNPNDANQNDDPDGDGWTLLEDYLDFVAYPYAIVAPGETVTLDLKDYFAGFYGQNGQSVVPTYVVEPSGSDVYTATVEGSTLKISGTKPDAGGVFRFGVTVNDGETTFTRRFGVAVTGEATGISAAWSEEGIDVARREFFTTDGRAVSQLQSHGVYIMKITDTAGKVYTTKVIKN
ncbi:MAG: T9SS C-terminal target domain-containing protein [Prevotella sp.]|nr:T9SS C-terminal target domain-containing protein [Prevotella sp.]